MIFPEFKRDLNHSFLVLPDKSYQINQDYQWEMVVSNKIVEFLSCNKQLRNGIASYYYDISSKQSLKRVYENKEMEYSDVKNILLSIYYAFMKMKEYLLDASYLVLDPEYFFINIENKEIQFVFYPASDLNVIDGFKVLSEFFLSRVNHKDEQAVEVIYQLFKEVRDDNFSFQRIITSMEKLEYYELEARLDMTKDKDECNINFSQEEECNKRVTIESGIMEESNPLEEEMVNPIKGNSPIGLFVIIGIGVMGVIFLIYTSMAWRNPVLLYGFLIMIFTAIILYIHNYIQDIKYQKEVQIIEHEKSKDIYSQDNMDIDFIHEINDNSVHDLHRKSSNFLTQGMETKKTFGNTELFGMEELDEIEEDIKFLKGSMNGKDISYQLDEFPMSVGKMKDCVDIVIEDSSISRIHARFYKETDKFLLTDMNSTNGTYRNGKRLSPNETVELEEGDQIQFAKFLFTFC